jgi:hypothetical protein
MNLKFSKKIVDRYPEDITLSHYGGDYFFYHREVYLDGEIVGKIFESSSGFNYCMLSGRHTPTKFGITIDSIYYPLEVSTTIPDSLTIHEFLNLIEK